MTSPDNPLWLQFWRDQRDDFHQEAVNPLLIKFWPSLKLARDSRVFVPLCGKSLDMIWLLQQGYEVVGVELSPVAVQAFFQENKFKPSRKKQGKFTVWRHGKLSILCGDYFSLTEADIGPIDMVYDRAALTALPEVIRAHYVSHLRRIIPDNCTIFLLTTEDAEANQTLAQTLGVAEEISALYRRNFTIDLAHVDSVFELNPDAPDQSAERTEYKVYCLRNRPGVALI